MGSATRPESRRGKKLLRRIINGFEKVLNQKKFFFAHLRSMPMLITL
jgi:hypothetical protein